MNPDAPPDCLDADGQRWWRHFCEDLNQRRKTVAPHLLSVYVQLWVQYLRVTARINRKGQVLVLKDDEGRLKAKLVSPEAVQQERLVKALKLIDAPFGFMQEVKADDPLEELRQRLLAQARPN